MTEKEYEIYLKVDHELKLEDARRFVADHLEVDEDDESLDGYDYEKLVARFEKQYDNSDSYSDIWWDVVGKYAEECDGIYSIGMYGHDSDGNMIHWKD